jgi:hypothetical protein
MGRGKVSTEQHPESDNATTLARKFLDTCKHAGQLEQCKLKIIRPYLLINPNPIGG